MANNRLILFLFASLLLTASTIWNHEAFILINSANNTFADLIIGNVAGLGDGLVSLLLTTLLLLYKPRLGLAALLTFFVAGFAIQVLKHLIDAPRPALVFEDIHILGQTLHHRSFPSGHSASAGAFVCIAFLLWSKHKVLAWSVSFAFALAAYSRIYCGAHFPVDVVSGFVMGAGIMYWSHTISQRWNISRWQENPWSFKLTWLFSMVSAVVLSMGYQIQPYTAEPLAFALSASSLFLLAYLWKKRYP